MSNRDIAIKVDDVSMAYKIYNKPIDMLKEALFKKIKHDIFWALKEITFNVYEGDRIGIIGPNGAGKSTLLRIITGNLTPTAMFSAIRIMGFLHSTCNK